MTRFTEFEKAVVGRAKTPARPVALQGVARIAAFGRALGALYKHAAVEAQAARDLRRLSDRMLADIGLVRSDIERVARLTANQTQPVERSLAAETGSFLYDLLIRPAVRFVRKRRAYASLMALDDRMLRDIGIAREEIPVLVQRLSGDRPQFVEAEAETVEDVETAPSFGVWNRYRATARELGQLDNHMLADIGFVRGDIDWVAEELAVRSFRGTANANSAPRAA